MITETDIFPRPGQSRIIVVDDDPLITALCLELFRRAGHLPVMCHSAEEARYQILDGLTPEIMFLDLKLPDKDGASLAKSMRDPTSSIYCPLTWIIGFTSSTDTTNIRKLLDAGVNDYLAKPASPLTLCNKLEVARYAYARTRVLKVRCELLEKALAHASP